MMNTTTITLAEQFATPALRSDRESLVRAAPALWRVLDAGQRVLGHLRIVPDALGLRYRAERYVPATGAFRLIGEFWSADDAVQTLRYLR